MGRTDVPHSISYMPDVTRTIAAVATSADGWGCPWLVPSITATQAEVVLGLRRAADTETVKISTPRQMQVSHHGFDH
jgi:hypothetical protein